MIDKWLCTFRLRETHEVQDSRRNVTQSTFLLFLALRILFVFNKGKLLRIASHNERNRVRGVGGVRVASFRVDHLLGVAVVGSDE
jgi:hypothetical protein